MSRGHILQNRLLLSGNLSSPAEWNRYQEQLMASNKSVWRPSYSVKSTLNTINTITITWRTLNQMWYWSHFARQNHKFTRWCLLGTQKKEEKKKTRLQVSTSERSLVRVLVQDVERQCQGTNQSNKGIQAAGKGTEGGSNLNHQAGQPAQPTPGQTPTSSFQHTLCSPLSECSTPIWRLDPFLASFVLRLVLRWLADRS